MGRQVAIIKDVGVGLRDVGRPVMWFNILISEASYALKVFDWETAGKIIKEAGVSDVKDLEGWPCWVKADGPMIEFDVVWKASWLHRD